MIKFLFFAQLAESAQRDFITLEFCAGRSTNDYLDELSKHLPSAAIESIAEGAIMLSINQAIASWDDKLEDGDEVGMLPPFSGG